MVLSPSTLWKYQITSPQAKELHVEKGFVELRTRVRWIPEVVTGILVGQIVPMTMDVLAVGLTWVASRERRLSDAKTIPTAGALLYCHLPPIFIFLDV